MNPWVFVAAADVLVQVEVDDLWPVLVAVLVFFFFVDEELVVCFVVVDDDVGSSVTRGTVGGAAVS